MKTRITALIAGALMGAGLVVAGMTDPNKVRAFLDITGQLNGYWDPTLMLVMGGAIAVNMPITWMLLKRTKPVLAEKFSLPLSQAIDKPLLAGAAIFGIGWGISGICPGPAIAGALTGGVGWLSFIAAMLIGFLLQKAVARVTP